MDLHYIQTPGLLYCRATNDRFTPTDLLTHMSGTSTSKIAGIVHEKCPAYDGNVQKRRILVRITAWESLV